MKCEMVSLFSCRINKSLESKLTKFNYNFWKQMKFQQHIYVLNLCSILMNDKGQKTFNLLKGFISWII